MKASLVAAVALALFASLTSAQWWAPLTSSGAWTDPNNYSPCAISCYNSPWPSPTASSDWSTYCATPTANPIVSCLSKSCSNVPSAWVAVSAADSSLCARYSSCTSLAAAASTSTFARPAGCIAFPWLGGLINPGPDSDDPDSWWWPYGWVGTKGCSFWTVTVTGSSGPTSGWTTTTEVITTTVTMESSTAVRTTTTTISATIVPAAAAVVVGGTTTTGTGSVAAATKTNAAMRLGLGGCVNGMGLVAAVAIGVMIAL